MTRTSAIARTVTRRLVSGLAHGSGATDRNGTVVRIMGQLVPLDSRPAPRSALARPRPERNDLLAEWTRSGDLTYGEAEALMALDETTRWSA